MMRCQAGMSVDEIALPLRACTAQTALAQVISSASRVGDFRRRETKYSKSNIFTNEVDRVESVPASEACKVCDDGTFYKIANM